MTVIFANHKRVSIGVVARKVITVLHMFLSSCVLGDHTKISVNTRNVFIECTATDITKVN